jgi:hypothetical protein
MPAFVARVTCPEYWGIGVVAGAAPLVVPTPYGYVVAGVIGVAMVLGLALLERIDGHDPEDQQATVRRRRTARVRKPRFAARVRFAVGRAMAKATF